MKRSRMKNYIADALYCRIPFSDREELLRVAETVLQTIEGGNPTQDAMLPPRIGVGEYCQGTFEAYVNEWESEEEPS